MLYTFRKGGRYLLLSELAYQLNIPYGVKLEDGSVKLEVALTCILLYLRIPFPALSLIYAQPNQYKMKLYPEIAEYIGKLSDLQIDESRKKLLTPLINYVRNNEELKLNFICTHNSRRSHLSQVWAQVAANYYGIAVETYSGGTEATAFHPNAVAALRRAGFRIEVSGDGNPMYTVSYSEDREPIVNFSKTYDDPHNPQSDFAAIMTCSEADAGCPVVFGAIERIKLFYEDPKIGDGTPAQDQLYDERCLQIASEMYYVFSTAKP